MRSAARSSAASHTIGCGASPRSSALHRLQQPRVQRDRLRRGEVQRAALAAQPPEVGRMLRIAAHAGDLVIVALDDDAAADAAVGTGGFGFAHGRADGCVVSSPDFGRGPASGAIDVERLVGQLVRVEVHRVVFDLAREDSPRSRRRAPWPGRRPARWSSCAAGTPRCRRTRCPGSAGRPCAGSGRAARTRDRSHRGTPPPPAPDSRATRRAPSGGMSSTCTPPAR